MHFCGFVAGRVAGPAHTYVLPSLPETATLLVPGLPWNDVEAMRQALTTLGWTWRGEGDKGYLVVELPCGSVLTFVRETTRAWKLLGGLVCGREGLRQVAMLARTYAYCLIRVESVRWNWEVTETQRQDGRLEVTCVAARKK